MNDNPSNTAATERPPKSIVRRLLEQTSVYALGNLAIKASGLLLAPLYLNPSYLAVRDFGYFALLQVTARMAIVFCSGGLGFGLMKFYTEPDSMQDSDALPFTTLVGVCSVSILVILITYMTSHPIAAFVLDDEQKTYLVLLAVVYGASEAVGEVPSMMYRIQERAWSYTFFVVFETLLVLVAAFLFLAVFRWQLTGLMVAYVTASACTTIIKVMVMLRWVPWRFDAHCLIPLFTFGFPLVLSSFATWFLSFGDRYLLKWLAGAEPTAVYEWSARLAGIFRMLFVQSFHLSFAVIGLRNLAQTGSTGDLHRTTFRHYTLFMGGVTLALALIANVITRILTPETRYYDTSPIVLVLCLGFMVQGLFLIVSNILYATGRSRLLSALIILAGGINLILNLILIPTLQVYGAALATYLAYLALASTNAYSVYKHDDLTFPWRDYNLTVLLVLTIFLASRSITARFPGFDLLISFIFVLCYIPGLFLLRLTTPGELIDLTMKITGLKKRRP